MTREELIQKNYDNLEKFADIIKNSQDETKVQIATSAYNAIVGSLKEIERKDDKHYEDLLSAIKTNDKTKESVKPVESEKTFEEPKLEEKVETKEKPKETENMSLNEYITKFVNSNPDIAFEYKNLIRELMNISNSNEPEKIDEWSNAFDAFVNKNNLDSKYMDQVKSNFIKTYIKKEESKVETAKPVDAPKPSTPPHKLTDAEIKDLNTPLRIMSTKKTAYSKGDKRALYALIAGGYLLPPSLLVTVPIFVIHRVLKNRQYRNEGLRKFLEEQNLDMQRGSNKVLNSEGREISKRSVGLAQYESIKDALIKVGAMKTPSKINPKYMASRLKSKLISTPLAKSIQNNIERSKAASEASTYLEAQEILDGDEYEVAKRGMGRL